MLHSIFTATLSYSKRIVTGFVSFVATVANKLKQFGCLVLNEAVRAKDYVVVEMKATLTAAEKVAVCLSFRKFIMFVMGFLCCFCFNEANGDLTWFERMFTSAQESFRVTMSRAKESIFKRVVQT